MDLINGGLHNANEKIWKPERIIELDDHFKYAVIVLNRPLHHEPLFLAHLWKKALVKVTVDGGTDRWLTLLKRNESLFSNLNLEPPDLITGDFDSVKKETLAHFRNRGSQVVETPDQNETDFSKSLIELSIFCKNKHVKINAIVALCHSSGRLDHIMANINTLFKYKTLTSFEGDASVFLMAGNSLTWLLEAGSHVIHIPEDSLKTPNSWCSLVPVGEKCKEITTSGLKWNLKNSSMSFGDMVSTSNTYNGGAKEVCLTISSPVLWSMQITPSVGGVTP